MLKQDTIQKIESLLKIKGLADAIKSDAEVDLTIDDLHVFTEDEIKIVKGNSYKDGKKAGVEMDVDDVKKELGLEFQGKTVKGLVNAIKEKTLADANIQPNEKVKELNEKVTNLQATIKDFETKIAEKDAEVVGVKINGELYKYIPEFGENAPALAKDEILQLMKANGYEPKLENNKTVFYKNGQLVKDKLENPVEAKDVVTTFLTEKKLVVNDPTPGGRGGSDKKPSTVVTNVKELKEQFQSQGKSVNGEEFAKAAEAYAKDNPEFFS